MFLGNGWETYVGGIESFQNILIFLAHKFEEKINYNPTP